MAVAVPTVIVTAVTVISAMATTAPTAGMSRMILMPAVGVVVAAGATVNGVGVGRADMFRRW
jgi:hypothetical protein